jgi:hypothetical protein
MAELPAARNIFYRKIIFTVIIVLFFVPVPTINLWWREAGNSCHTILFFIISFSLYHLIASRIRYSNKILIYFIVFILGMSLGVLIELLQSFTQRESSINDVYRDLYGIIASLCLIAVINLKDINRQKLTVVFYIFTGAAFLLMGMIPLIKLSWHYIERGNAFPVIVDLDADWSSSFIQFNNAEIMKATGLNKKENDNLSLIRFNHGQYPGISVIEPEPDWSNYHKLHLKIFSSYEHDIDLVLRVHDKQHNQDLIDRFNKKLPVKPGLNDFEIALNQIQNGPVNRQLDLKSVAGLTLFSNEQEDQLQFELSPIYLE